MMTEIPEEIIRIEREAKLLHSENAVKRAITRLAKNISEVLENSNPLILCVMNGGLLPTGWLLPLLHFPLQLDYVHVTRYRGGTRGHELEWRARPSIPQLKRTILLIDDIYDVGITLSQIANDCLSHGALRVLTAVLVRKQRDRNVMQPDFIGLEAPDRYLFGCGMDYKNYLRNLPAIYVLPSKYEKNGT